MRSLTAKTPFAFGGVITHYSETIYMRKMSSTANIMRIAIFA
jgi:hypothetical protein